MRLLVLFWEKNGITKILETMETVMNNVGVKNNNVSNKYKHKEGPVAKAIEHQTAKLPSDLFLWTSFAIMGVSLTMKLLGKDHISLFIGQWAPSLLIMGLYNKVVKVEGHDKTEK